MGGAESVLPVRALPYLSRVLGSQPHQAPAARASRALIEALGRAVEYYVSGSEFHAAPQHRRVLAHHKPYKYQRRVQRHIGNAGHILLATQQLQLMERYPGQVGVECTLRGNEQFDPRLAQARLVIVGIDKGARAASRHLRSCIPAGSSRVPGGHDARPTKRLGSVRRTAADYANTGNCQGEPAFFCARGSSGGRRSVTEGGSPNSERYATENRPNSQKP